MASANIRARCVPVVNQMCCFSRVTIARCCLYTWLAVCIDTAIFVMAVHSAVHSTVYATVYEGIWFHMVGLLCEILVYQFHLSEDHWAGTGRYCLTREWKYARWAVDKKTVFRHQSNSKSTGGNYARTFCLVLNYPPICCCCYLLNVCTVVAIRFCSATIVL